MLWAGVCLEVQTQHEEVGQGHSGEIDYPGVNPSTYRNLNLTMTQQLN
jgi:hypothetical protein